MPVSGEQPRDRRRLSDQFPSERAGAARPGPTPALRFDDEPGVEFHPGVSEMFAILRTNGFELLDFRELYAPEGAVDHEYYDTVPAAWAKQWPDEEIWRLRLRPR